MSPLTQFFLAVGTVFFTENIVLTRAFGADELILLARERKKLGSLCLGTLFLTELAGILSWLVLRPVSFAPAVPLVYAAVLFALYLGVLFIKDRLPFEDPDGFVRSLRPVLFGTVLAGPMLLIAQNGQRFSAALAIGLGSGLGFCLALFFLLQAQRHFKESSVPAPFRGLPVTLLYLGLLSLAFYGILGSGGAL